MEHWVNLTEEKIKKNLKRELLKWTPIIVGSLLGILLVANGKTFLGVIVVLTGYLLSFFFPKTIKLKFSDVIGHNLYRLASNIEKFNGEDQYLKEEAKGLLFDLDIDIYDYITRENNVIFDFSEEKNKKFMKQLLDNLGKVWLFFDDYKTYDGQKEKLRKVLWYLAIDLHQNDLIIDDAYKLLEEFEAIGIPKKEIRPALSSIFKKIIANRLTKLVMFLSIFAVAVWFVPSYTNVDLSQEGRLLIILPVIGLTIAENLFSRQRSKEYPKQVK